MTPTAFATEARSFARRAELDLKREVGAIEAANAAAGLYHSGKTLKQLAGAATASAASLASILLHEVDCAAPPGSRKSRRLAEVAQQVLGEYQEELWQAVGFSKHFRKPDRSAEAAVRDLLERGREDVRRLVQRHSDGRAGGPVPANWAMRHPFVLAVLGAAVTLAAAVIGGLLTR